MEFFVDTAIVDEIKELIEWGVVDGVTTNPSLMAKSGRDPKEVIKEICELVDGPISAEVIATDKDGMLKEAMDLVSIHKNIVIKLPMTADGLKALKVLSGKGIKTNITLIFSAAQALLAAKNGATYVSPFLGRLDDIGHTGMELIDEIRTVFDNYSFTTKILAASLRHPLHLKETAMLGADVATLPPKVIKQLVKHPLTESGLEKFLADYQNSLK